MMYFWLFVGLLFCAVPSAAVYWANWFAQKHGCDLQEKLTMPCPVDGAEWGELLHTAYVSGWLMVITFPLAMVLSLALAFIAFSQITRTWIFETHRR